MPAACCPAGHRADDRLRHRANEALDLQDVQAPGPRRVDLLAASGGSGLVVGAVHFLRLRSRTPKVLDLIQGDLDAAAAPAAAE